MAQADRLEIQRLEELLRSGRIQEVQSELKMRRLNLSRELLPEWANLSRRAGLPDLSLRLLRPYIRGQEKSASPKEISIYSASLSAVGAIDEAFTLLTPLQKDPIPEIQLHSGFALIHRWEYREAIPFFLKYLELEGPTEFQRAVARLNLAACYSFCQEHELLFPLLEVIMTDALKNQWHPMTKNTYIIHAQAAIAVKSWTAAENSLAAAIELSRKEKLDDYLLEKWSVILRLHRDRRAPSLRAALSSLRSRSLALRQFEGLRDADYYQGLLRPDPKLLQKVFFGTPFQSYRQRTLNAVRGQVDIPNQLRLRMNSKRGPVVDLSGGKLEGSSLMVLRALAADLYKPIKIGGLFAALHPGDYFDPASSPGRVRTAISRAREQWEDQKLSLRIHCQGSEYSLAADTPVDLLIPRHYPASKVTPLPDLQLIKGLKTAYPYRAFSSQKAAEVLDLPLERTRRLLKSAEEAQMIFASGSRRSKLFRFAK